jgi:hypothetical protein
MKWLSVYLLICYRFTVIWILKQFIWKWSDFKIKKIKKLSYQQYRAWSDCMDENAMCYKCFQRVYLPFNTMKFS